MGNITSSSSFTDYRWLKPIQDPHGRDYYTPLPLNRMLTIESKYKKYQHHEITQSEKTKYNFDFDSETLKENDIINYRKKLPIEDLNIYRHLRNYKMYQLFTLLTCSMIRNKSLNLIIIYLFV